MKRRQQAVAAVLVALLLFAVATVAAGAVTVPGPTMGAAPPGQLLVMDTLIVCNKVAVPFILDGRLGKWDGYPSTYLDGSTAQYVGGIPWGAGDINARLRCAWDTQWLYLNADMSDDVLIVDSSTIWDDDSLEIALDGNSDRTCCSAYDRQITISLDDRLADFGVVQSTSNVRRVVVPRSGGYVIEMAVPFSSFLVSTPYQGVLVGFTFGLNDDDDGGRRDSYLLWMGANIRTDFARFGALVLMGPLSGTPTPTATATPLPPTATATPTPRPPLATPTTLAPTATVTPTSVAATPTRTAVPATATSTAAPATATRTPIGTPPTATPTSVAPTATATPVGTPGPTERLDALESSLPRARTLLERILAILQSAAYLPDAPPTPAATATPTATATHMVMGYNQRVNAGGPAVTDSRGQTWAADRAYTAGSWGYLGGMVATTTVAISGTVDDVLYQSERYNFTSYRFDVPAGIYDVELRFAEIYQYAGPGQRLFSVQIEGTPVITDVDLFSLVGPYTAYDFISQVTVTDGQLTIDVSASKGTAKISALRVSGRGPAGPTPTPSLEERTANLETRLSELERLLGDIITAFGRFLGISR